MCVCLVSQACLTHCDPMNCSLPGFSVHRIFQTWILEWVAISYSRGSCQHRDRTKILWHFLHWQVDSLLLYQLGSLSMTCQPLVMPQTTVWLYSEVKSLSSVWLCYPMNCSLPGFSVHRILQARVLEWIAIPFSRGSSRPRDWTLVSSISGRFYAIWAIGKSCYLP